MNETKLWTNSLTKGVLTTYAEGLACATFDKHTNYNVIRVAGQKWYVLHNDAGKTIILNDTKPFTTAKPMCITRCITW